MLLATVLNAQAHIAHFAPHAPNDSRCQRKPKQLLKVPKRAIRLCRQCKCEPAACCGLLEEVDGIDHNACDLETRDKPERRLPIGYGDEFFRRNAEYVPGMCEPGAKPHRSGIEDGDRIDVTDSRRQRAQVCCEIERGIAGAVDFDAETIMWQCAVPRRRS